MSEPVQTFVQRVLAGSIVDPSTAVLDAIGAWHESDSDVELHDWLGMTRDEYALFVERPNALRIIFHARHFGLDALELIRTEVERPSARIAARGAESEQIAELANWLRRTGRLQK
jgi:hypothetical protein